MLWGREDIDEEEDLLRINFRLIGSVSRGGIVRLWSLVFTYRLSSFESNSNFDDSAPKHNGYFDVNSKIYGLNSNNTKPHGLTICMNHQ